MRQGFLSFVTGFLHPPMLYLSGPKAPPAVNHRPSAPPIAPAPVAPPSPMAVAPVVTPFKQRKGVDKRRVFGSAGADAQEHSMLGSGI